MPGAATGSSAVPPVKVCPLVTVSRLVPSAGDLGQQPGLARRRPGRGRRRSPRRRSRCPARTAPARSLRVRSPMLASAARSPGLQPGRGRRGRAAGCGGHDGRLAAGGPGVGDDVPVEHLDPPPGPGGDRVVVGDDDDRGALRVEFFQQGQDGGAGGRVQVAGRLVGQHHRRASPATARAIATRCRSPPDSWVGRAAALCASPTRSSAASGQPPPRGRGGPRRTAARRRRCPARSGARRGRTAGTRTRSGSPAAPASSRSAIRATSRPVTRTVPVVGRSRVPIRCSSVVLPDPDGPTTATSSPARHRQAHPVQRPHRRLPRVHLRHLVQLQHRHRPRAAAGPGRPGPPALRAVMTPAPRRAGRGSAPRSPAPARRRRRRARAVTGTSAACSPRR